MSEGIVGYTSCTTPGRAPSVAALVVVSPWHIIHEMRVSLMWQHNECTVQQHINNIEEMTMQMWMHWVLNKGLRQGCQSNE